MSLAAAVNAKVSIVQKLFFFSKSEFFFFVFGNIEKENE